MTSEQPVAQVSLSSAVGDFTMEVGSRLSNPSGRGGRRCAVKIDELSQAGNQPFLRGFLERIRALFRRRTARPNPRPIRVDEQGRMFEMTGEPIIVPGLEPDKVLKGMADDAAGRTRPLSEIIAQRKP
jgi:hypothetical protein